MIEIIEIKENIIYWFKYFSCIHHITLAIQFNLSICAYHMYYGNLAYFISVSCLLNYKHIYFFHIEIGFKSYSILIIGADFSKTTLEMTATRVEMYQKQYILVGLFTIPL